MSEAAHQLEAEDLSSCGFPYTESLLSIDHQDVVQAQIIRFPNQLAANYFHRCQLQDNILGKVILCKEENETYSLWGHLPHRPWIDSPRKAKDDLVAMIRSSYRECFGSYLPHDKIPHEGKIIGGGWLAMSKGYVFIGGNSDRHGKIDVEIAKHCLSGDPLIRRVIDANHLQLPPRKNH